MKQSKLFYKSTKEAASSEASYNSQLLLRAGYIEKVSSGVFSFLPLGWRVIQKIARILREEMEKENGQEVFLPTLHPKELWQTSGRLEIYEDLYRLKEDEKEFLLGPTHEEIVTPLAKRVISSYQDLPLALFQIQNKFRMEKRAKSGLLRCREFLMKDLYSFHADKDDLNRYYEKMKKAYFRIFKRVGILEYVYLTFASGGTFSEYSHEFQALTPFGEDIIYICKNCHQAINREIKDKTPVCPNCQKNDFQEEKAIEVGNIFPLGTKFSQPFELTFTDKDGVKKPVEMGCYGIGLGRLMGIVVEVLKDEKGIVWPKEISPFNVHLVEIKGKGTSAYAEKVYQLLGKKGLEVLYDDREKSAGEKLVESDLLGITARLIVSEKTIAKKMVELKFRNKAKAEILSTNAAISRLLK